MHQHVEEKRVGIVRQANQQTRTGADERASLRETDSRPIKYWRKMASPVASERDTKRVDALAGKLVDALDQQTEQKIIPEKNRTAIEKSVTRVVR